MIGNKETLPLASLLFSTALLYWVLFWMSSDDPLLYFALSPRGLISRPCDKRTKKVNKGKRNNEKSKGILVESVRMWYGGQKSWLAPLAIAPLKEWWVSACLTSLIICFDLLLLRFCNHAMQNHNFNLLIFSLRKAFPFFWNYVYMRIIYSTWFKCSWLLSGN